MADLYKMFGTDKDAETNGVWIEFGDGVAIKIARAGGRNKNFEKALEKKSRPIRKAMQAGLAPDGVVDKIMIETFASTVVLDWRNITDAQGNPWPFTTENCVKLFTDLPDLFKHIYKEADDLANFQAASDEEDAKN